LQVTHEFEMTSTCPMNGREDRYSVILTTDKFVAVEDILQFAEEFRHVKVFQENITMELSKHFDAKVVTTGLHGNVRTKCECSPQ